MLPWFLQSIFLFYFYTDVLGITPEQAGFIFFVVIFWDAITDPIMGIIAERTKTRWGKYRPYLLFGAIPLSISLVLTYLKPDWPVADLFILALATHMLFRLAYTITYIPYTSLLAQLSSNSDERASIAAYKTIFVYLGTLTVSFYTRELVALFGDGDEAKGFLYTSMTFGILLIFALWACFLSTSETASEEKQIHYSFMDAVRTLQKNGPFWLVFFGVIAFTGSYTIYLKSIVYYFKYFIAEPDKVRWGLSAVSIAGLFAIPVWAYIVKRTSKKFVWVAGSILAISGLIFFNVNGSTSVPIVVANLFIISWGISAFLMTFYAMLADTVEYGEMKTGVRVEAVSFSILSFANKFSLAIGGGSLGYLLASVGYQANVAQTPEAMDGIKNILTLVPATGFLISGIIIFFYPINAAYHDEIRQKITERQKSNA